MLLKRPRILMVERRERADFSLDSLLSGGAGLARRQAWIALAPHLDAEVELELADLSVIEALSPDAACPRADLDARFGAARVDALVAAGLLVGDHDGHATLRERERVLGETAWWPPAAVAHALGRWDGVDIAADEERLGRVSLAQLLDHHGPPPAEATVQRPRASWLPLPAPATGPLDQVLRRRASCRNFIAEAGVPLADLSTTLHRVFGAQAAQVLAPGATMLKKNSPSGGGLHPIDAYVLAQRVDGLEPGLYHYQCLEHVLEPMQVQPAATVAGFAHELVAGQAWFANAPVLVLMAARFQRNFWKYRRHAKAWKVILLDAGHLSQNFQLSATEQGYGAFVTGAINDRCAERLFGFDGLGTGAIAVCGMGRRAAAITTIEFDPLGLAPRG